MSLRTNEIIPQSGDSVTFKSRLFVNIGNISFELTPARIAAINAEISALSAASDAAIAEAAKIAAVAASQASGDILFFDTYADFTAALPLPDLQVVEIFFDETRNGNRARYRIEGGSVVYKFNPGAIQEDDRYLEKVGGVMTGNLEVNATTTTDDLIVNNNASVGGNLTVNDLTINGALGGSFTIPTADSALTVDVTTEENINASRFIAFLDGQTGNQAVKADSGLRYNPQTNALTAASFVGVASQATILETARTITLAGDVVGSTSFNGSQNVTITTVVGDDSHNHTSNTGNYTVGGNLTVNGGLVTLNGTGRITGIDTVTDPTDAASKGYVDSAVAGGGSSLTVTQEETTGNQDIRYIAFIDGSGATEIKFDTGLQYNPDDNWLEAADLYANNIVYSDNFEYYGNANIRNIFTTNQPSANITYNFATGTVISGFTKLLNIATNSQIGNGTTINMGYSVAVVDDSTRINLNSFFVTVPKTLRTNNVIANTTDDVLLYSNASAANSNPNILIGSIPTASGFAKNIELGTGGATGSTTNILIGSSLGDTSVQIDSSLGISVNGNINMNGGKITGVGTPTAGSDVTTKDYVDGLAFGGGSGGTLNIVDETISNSTYYPAMTSATTGVTPDLVVSSTKLSFVPSTGQLNVVEINSTSDVNLKENVVTSTGLDVIKQLRGVEFYWKDSGSKSSGVIAQEVENVIPHAVTETASGYKAVNYNSLDGYYIEAIKQLVSRLEAAEAKIAALESSN